MLVFGTKTLHIIAHFKLILQYTRWQLSKSDTTGTHSVGVLMPSIMLYL